MRVGIDASNLRDGGGRTHLAALLAHAEPAESGIERVVVWAPRATLDELEDRPWLAKAPSADLEKSTAARNAWRRRVLPGLAGAACDILYAPGGLCTDLFHPVVTMSRNMLPFEPREMLRYGPSRMLLRLALLRLLQKRSFRTADGVIFLSRFAQEHVMRAAAPLAGETAIIPHGIADAFLHPPRPQRRPSQITSAEPWRLLYVSIVDVYKHQWQVAEAVSRLRREGIPVCIDFVGSGYPKALNWLTRVLRRRDPAGHFLHYSGAVDHQTLPARYQSADGFVFASSCENLPNILLEAMAAGLAIACSNRGPMPEVLGGAGLYFDPLKPGEIATTLRTLFGDAELRFQLARAAYDRARSYSWTLCARQTFEFLRHVFQRSSGRTRAAGVNRD